MAETQKATIGYNGEFWLSTTALSAGLVEMVEVQEFDIPSGGSREQVEKTHLKSPGYRREYLSSFFEDVDFEVVLNSRPLSTTDATIEAARVADTIRAFKVVIPEDGVKTTQVTGTCRCTGYNRGRVTKDGVLTATATFRVVTVDALAAYVP